MVTVCYSRLRTCSCLVPVSNIYKRGSFAKPHMLSAVNWPGVQHHRAQDPSASVSLRPGLPPSGVFSSSLSGMRHGMIAPIRFLRARMSRC